MLVKFTSNTSGQIMMFSPVARVLLEIIGKDCSARGVITCEQLPNAIEKLRLAADGSGAGRDTTDDQPQAAGDSADDQATPEPPVGLAQRAYPLIELLQWTRKEEGFILWEAAKDF
ncbi:DUF1840 domain-containing protein [Candidatus Accumulibacter sp. ACC003]|uniref:DUF1840 domain-containing protein n=1 Tax=Candidatus Accumulibacter sp. ACC003 TaxID=2823334 RepID=UPI0025BD87A5|nr:DUF1840 domain-containing protein [Candidatus Accumulibacter sp. ACC003]